jgi:hypothetical protein
VPTQRTLSGDGASPLIVSACERSTRRGPVRYRCGMQRSLQTTTPDISGVRLLLH